MWCDGGLKMSCFFPGLQWLCLLLAMRWLLDEMTSFRRFFFFSCGLLDVLVVTIDCEVILIFFFWCLLLYEYFFSCYLIIIFLGGGIVVRFSARFSFLALIPLSLDACLAFFSFFFLLDLWCHWVSKMVFHLLGFLVADPFLFPFFFSAWLVRSCISISRCHWSQAPKLLGGWSLRACGVGCVLPLVLQA